MASPRARAWQVQTRVGMVSTAGAQLSKALTIAIRYSAVRCGSQRHAHPACVCFIRDSPYKIYRWGGVSTAPASAPGQVRRQGFPADGVAEPAVLDYQMQQHTSCSRCSPRRDIYEGCPVLKHSPRPVLFYIDSPYGRQQMSGHNGGGALVCPQAFALHFTGRYMRDVNARAQVLCHGAVGHHRQYLCKIYCSMS
jgi:hypothetical protein